MLRVRKVGGHFRHFPKATKQKPVHRSGARSSLLFWRCNCFQLHYHFFIDPFHYSRQASILAEINKLAPFTKFGGPTQLARWFALTFTSQICIWSSLSGDLWTMPIHKAKSKCTTGVNVIKTQFNNRMGINKGEKEKTEKYHHYHIIITVKLLKRTCIRLGSKWRQIKRYGTGAAVSFSEEEPTNSKDHNIF